MLFLDVPVLHLVIAFFVTLMGAMVQGSVGFGLAMISAPVLAIINPAFVPGSVMFAAMVLCVMLALRERDSIATGEVAISSVSRLVTTIPTAMFMGLIDQQTFSVVFSIVLLVAVGFSLSGFHMPFNKTNLAIASGISGITNTISSIGGPPMALVYQDQKGDHIRATLSTTFAIGGVFAMIALALAGQFGMRDLALGVALLPGIVLGFALSRYTSSLLDAHAMRPAVLGVAGLSAAVILVQSLGVTG